MKKLSLPFVPTLFTVGAFIVLCVLGTWQVQRLQWKNALVASVNEQSSRPPIELSDVPVNAWSDLLYRRVIVRGVYDHEREAHLYTGPRVMYGKKGYDILTPLVMHNGVRVVVNRGWVPAEQKLSNNRPETITSGEVVLEGMVHLQETPGYFTPENDVTKNIWFWIDVPEILNAPGDTYVRRLRVDGDKTLPVGGDVMLMHRNDHLQYAITWYSLAIILLVIYGLFCKKRRDEENV